MGQENSLYYNEELKRWVERGKEHEVQEESLPPPPTAKGGDAATNAKQRNEGDPASRYVAAGDFGGRGHETTQTDAKKSFVTPSTLTTHTPPSGEFFIPATTPAAASVETSPPSQGAAKYKGYRIPTFIKPEGREGTQEEYEEEELRKFKAKIDRKEARKNGGVDHGAENGVVHDRPKAKAKLEDTWLTESGSTFEDTRFTSTPEMPHPQSPIDESFAAASFGVGHQSQANGGEVPVELLPVEPESHLGGFDQGGNMGLETEKHGVQSMEWFHAEQPQAPAMVMEDGPVDFDSWDPNPDAQPQPAAVDNTTFPEAIPQQEDPAEAEYPGVNRGGHSS